MVKNYKVGQKVYFNYKGENIEARITRINQKTLSIVAVADNLKGRISYNSVLDSPISVQEATQCPNLKRSEYSTQTDLENLLDEVKQEFSYVFNSIFNEAEKQLLLTVRIYWGKRYTYRRLGTYQYGLNANSMMKYKHNTITLSKSLKNVPKFVIKKTIYHELLHIKFHKHGKEFRFYERKYQNTKEVEEYIRLLCIEIRNHGIYRILKLPITQKRTIEQKDKKGLLIEKAKNLKVFPVFMDENNLNEFDIRYLKMRIKSIKNYN